MEWRKIRNARRSRKVQNDISRRRTQTFSSADLAEENRLALRAGEMKSSKLQLLGIIVLSILIAWAGTAQAMRCGSRLISEGDPREKVLSECGPPSSVDEWEEERYDWFDRFPPSSRYREFERYGNAYRVKIHVRVELWTYNHGPSRFIDYVRLENGIVRGTYSGGYGFRGTESNCRHGDFQARPPSFPTSS